MPNSNRNSIVHASSSRRSGEGEKDDILKNLENAYLGRPNITMIIPWVYDMCESMKKSSRSSSREGDSEDEIREGLKTYLGRPNIDMIIPWVYDIYQSVKSGGGGGGGEGSDLEWDERDFNGGNG